MVWKILLDLFSIVSPNKPLAFFLKALSNFLWWFLDRFEDEEDDEENDADENDVNNIDEDKSNE